MKRDLSLWDNQPYRMRARSLRDAASANPKATCWLCGRTLEEGPRHRNGQPSTWHADHVVAGDPRSELRLAHSLCNQRRGRPVAKGRREPRSPNA
jgi:hypothetical protein